MTPDHIPALLDEEISKTKRRIAEDTWLDKEDVEYLEQYLRELEAIAIEQVLLGE